MEVLIVKAHQNAARPRKYTHLFTDSSLIKCLACQEILESRKTMHKCTFRVRFPASLCKCTQEAWNKSMSICAFHKIVQLPVESWPDKYKKKAKPAIKGE